MFRYKHLANELEAKILKGIYQPGERLPSIRQLHNQLRLSVSTVYQAYVDLETTGLIEARPRSGYYVSPVSLKKLQEPVFKNISSAPQQVELAAMVNSVIKAITNPDMLPLGSSTICSDLLPYKHISRILKSFTGKEIKTALSYSLTQGIPELRRQIARRTLGLVKDIDMEDIIITNGCSEAASLCLQAVAKPGDTIAIETPTHFGYLQLLKELGMMVVEVPTHPRYGVDVDALEKILTRSPVKACLFMPNFQNPLGALMPNENKARLVKILERLNVPVIEDDIYGDLYYENIQRPSLLKSFETKNLLMTCSSFSKTLAPGLRIGWIFPGERFKEKILRLKAGTTVCTSTLDQQIMAHFLREGAYERHLRNLRNSLKKQIYKTAMAVQKYFPQNTRLAVPHGGSLLWIQLPGHINSLKIYQQALEDNISILPGLVCSASGRFTNYIRIGCGHPFTDAIENGIKTLGDFCRRSI